MGHIFISYSKKDVLYAEKLVNALRREGFNPWVDMDELGAGTHWQTRLYKQIVNCDAYILIMSRNASASRWVPDELVTAKSKGKPIFPLLLDDTELFLAIQTIQCENVRGGKLPPERFYEQLAKVTKRQKKANQKVDSIHLVDPTQKKIVDERVEKIMFSLNRGYQAGTENLAVFKKVAGNVVKAIGDSKLVKDARLSVKKNLNRKTTPRTKAKTKVTAKKRAR